jgi:hypothetical protein
MKLGFLVSFGFEFERCRRLFIASLAVVGGEHDLHGVRHVLGDDRKVCIVRLLKLSDCSFHFISHTRSCLTMSIASDYLISQVTHWCKGGFLEDLSRQRTTSCALPLSDIPLSTQRSHVRVLQSFGYSAQGPSQRHCCLGSSEQCMALQYSGPWPSGMADAPSSHCIAEARSQ